MELFEIKKRINQAFGKYEFIEDGHYYLCNGKRVGISTTGLIGQYENEFDSQTISKQVANKRGISQQQVLEEWRIENLHSTIKGSMIHEFAQSLWEGKEYQFDFSKIPQEINLERLKKDIEKCVPQAINFYNDYKDRYELIGCEVYLGDEDYDECGATDQIMYNKLTGGISIIDYKTNKEIQRVSKYKKKMLLPLQKYDDCNYIHYSLQLSDYKFKFEKNTGLKVDETFIVYFNVNANNYEIIEPLEMEKEVKKILEYRRINKMAKMLLVIGEGGSGKTASLRNLKPEEHYYIDCDKKGLNYKGWKNDYNEEKKNYFKTNDGDLVIKALQNVSEKAEHIKYITIDTINSIMIADEMKRMKGKSFNEWQDLAKCIFDIIDIVPDLRDDLTVIFIGHTQTEDDGFVRLLTNGRKLNKIGLEKYFNTVLLAKARDGEYIFETRANNSTARTPMGAFEDLEIENDIIKVLEVLKEY
jgi:hypothetical protein